MEEGEDALLRCYGLWQTQEWTPPAVSDEGKVPENSYGNWEVWSPAHVPNGAVHLRLPRIALSAKTLGMHFVPALVGFRSKGDGKYGPEIDGILVAASCEEILLDAHAALDAAARLLRTSRPSSRPSRP